MYSAVHDKRVGNTRDRKSRGQSHVFGVGRRGPSTLRRDQTRVVPFSRAPRLHLPPVHSVRVQD